MKSIKFVNGLVPAIIQDSQSREVLMLGYMNQDALDQTLASKKITFYSRSKQRLWMKGEESGNTLELVSIKNDCDSDALLIQAKPAGPTCHKGTKTCWGEVSRVNYYEIERLENSIQDRIENPKNGSYVSALISEGINKVAQKVGEEAVEVVIEAMDNNDALFLEESADLLFHYLILLQAKGYSLKEVLAVLKLRNSNN